MNDIRAMAREVVGHDEVQVYVHTGPDKNDPLGQEEYVVWSGCDPVVGWRERAELAMGVDTILKTPRASGSDAHHTKGVEIWQRNPKAAVASAAARPAGTHSQEAFIEKARSNRAGADNNAPAFHPGVNDA